MAGSGLHTQRSKIDGHNFSDKDKRVNTPFDDFMSCGAVQLTMGAPVIDIDSPDLRVDLQVRHLNKLRCDAHMTNLMNDMATQKKTQAGIL